VAETPLDFIAAIDYRSAMFQRFLDLPALAAARSFFLLGPRQTGKSTLLRAALPDALYFDLLDAQTFRSLSANPGQMEERVRALRGRRAVVVVDEIQKLPELLDEVHRLMELKKSLRFVLTGSSARKLRTGGRNLLGGRASLVRMHPIVYPEIRDVAPRRPWTDLLHWGGLPSVLTSDTPKERLQAYVGLYLQEEIRSEGLARSIPNFSRFLETAAAMNGEIVNYTKLGHDAQLAPRTVRDYFEILQDTLVGDLLPPFRGTRTRKAVATEKLFFFDVGVVHALLERWTVPPRTTEYGRVLEHLVERELRASIDYLRSDRKLFFWKSLSQMEVDFVLAEGQKPVVAIEIKASRAIAPADLKGLRAFAEDWPRVRKIVVSLEPHARTTEDRIEILPVESFLSQLWDREI
jgi:predicted AAA+ superfamily ATPase